MLQFNEKGLLFPPQNILSDLDEFEKNFVFNQHREALFQKYLSYLIDLQLIGIWDFIQWIDGSFVTKKKIPNDIDIVTFIAADFYNLYQQKLIDLNKKYRDLDCYYIKDFPLDHPKQMISDFDRKEWLFLFSTDRKKQNKGFIELKF
jgi:hypothetical protein